MKCNSREQEIKKLEINVIILFCYLFPPPPSLSLHCDSLFLVHYPFNQVQTTLLLSGECDPDIPDIPTARMCSFLSNHFYLYNIQYTVGKGSGAYEDIC